MRHIKTGRNLKREEFALNYDCIIVGGGFAGLQAAIQLGRYHRKVLVLDSEDGRSNLCNSYHNILGWPEGVSGPYIRETGRKQAEALGIEFMTARAVEAGKSDGYFSISADNGEQYSAHRLLIATGVKDRIPGFPELVPCLGISVFICPDCDGYETRNRRTIVMGAGKSGAEMALTLTYWTRDLVYINHERVPFDDEILKELRKHKIVYIEEPIKQAVVQGTQFKGAVLQNDTFIEGNYGFIAFGGNEVRSSLAGQLGVELTHNRHIPVDARTKMTNVKHVWAAGDVAVHSEQAVIAMGDGSQAAIWIHKSLLQ
ncbi:NAD(P)/FAD-dependent oxidoreductase [Paenibacillus sp. sptzw28]|uniref:NAD(P)/FAD-dependent oxidoreductase n=1 Tax=Paenibacillus sp. sptzw28 TaxID=715179 RepID=UPI002161F7E0|nr:NAD(P)/FAD-dependent oxidoreductase [Paenibacillus sp. sptzw28]